MRGRQMSTESLERPAYMCTFDGRALIVPCCFFSSVNIVQHTIYENTVHCLSNCVHTHHLRPFFPVLRTLIRSSRVPLDGQCTQRTMTIVGSCSFIHTCWYIYNLHVATPQAGTTPLCCLPAVLSLFSPALMDRLEDQSLSECQQQVLVAARRKLQHVGSTF